MESSDSTTITRIKTGCQVQYSTWDLNSPICNLTLIILCSSTILKFRLVSINMYTREDREYINFLKSNLQKNYSFEGIHYDVTVRRSRRNDRFGVQDVIVNIDFSSKSDHSELFKIALVIESALIKAIYKMIKSLHKNEADVTLVFPTILLPGLSHPAIRIGARYLTDKNLTIKCKFLTLTGCQTVNEVTNKIIPVVKLKLIFPRFFFTFKDTFSTFLAFLVKLSLVFFIIVSSKIFVALLTTL